MKGYELLPEMWEVCVLFQLLSQPALCCSVRATGAWTVPQRLRCILLYMCSSAACLFFWDFCVLYHCHCQKKRKSFFFPPFFFFSFAVARLRYWIIEHFQDMETVIRFSSLVFQQQYPNSHFSLDVCVSFRGQVSVWKISTYICIKIEMTMRSRIHSILFHFRYDFNYSR